MLGCVSEWTKSSKSFTKVRVEEQEYFMYKI